MQLQTPLCIESVGKYLSAHGPLPFIVRSPSFIPQGITLVRENILESNVHFEFKVTEGYFVVALPSKQFLSGFSIVTKGAKAIKVTKLVKSEWQHLFSGAISFLIKIETESEHEVFVDFSIFPGIGSTVDGVGI